jgi:hypothetical protein
LQEEGIACTWGVKLQFIRNSNSTISGFDKAGVLLYGHFEFAISSFIDKLNVSTLSAIACNKNSLFAIDKKGKKCPLHQAGIYNLNAALISGSSVFSTYALTLSYGAFVSISFLNCAKSLPTLVIAADVDVSCFASLNIS